MIHLFKLCNKFADIFISNIDDKAETITYDVRDKETGIMTEPKRQTKFIINDVSKMVHFDAREIPLDLFGHIYNTLKND